MSFKYYRYKERGARCPKCQWKGMGKELITGDCFDTLFELECPNCDEVVGIVPFPTFDDVLNYGTDEEKAQARRSINHIAKIEKTQINSESQLASIEGTIVVEMKESEDEDDIWMEVYTNQQLIWKEIVNYEYYERFIEICELLDRKYKGQIELINFNSSVYLLGDRLSASKKIDSCIKRIKTNYNIE